MCGIVGALSHNQGMCDPSIIRGMVDEVKHRGPNSTGVWVSEVGLVALGHSRLSILDLTESGSQPMHSDSKRYALSFNGEIYNHCAIRQELEINWPTTKGWVGRSDSETLLSAVELWGLEKTLEKLMECLL